MQTETTTETVHPVLGAFCVALCERADALGYKGKRADNFALDSFCAAATILIAGIGEGHDAGYAGPETNRLANFLGTMAAMVICVRGMVEVRVIADRHARAKLPHWIKNSGGSL